MSDGRAAGKEDAADGVALGRNGFVVSEVDRVAHAEALPDDGLQVRQLLSLLERDGTIGRHLSAVDCVVDLPLEAHVSVRCRREMDQRRRKRCSGGFGTCEDLQVCLALHFLLRESVADEAANHVIPCPRLGILLETLAHQVMDRPAARGGRGSAEQPYIQPKKM